MSISCPDCDKVFGSKLEYRLHWSHNHYGSVRTPLTQSVPVSKLEEMPPVTPVEETKEEDEAPYSLATSGEGLGELYPVLKDAFGNVIDGFHRLGENPNWHTEVRPQIDTPVKLQLAMLAANFNRRKMASEEVTQRITFLIKAGLSIEEIAKTAGLTERTARKYMPQEFKNAIKVEAGKTPKTFNSAEDVQHTVTIPDTVPTVPTSTAPEINMPESAPQPKPEVEPEEETTPLDTPTCPLCKCVLDPNEYQQIKQAVTVKFGKEIQTLFFPTEA